MDRLDDDIVIERVLRWATVERGTAGLSDTIGPQVIVPSPPSSFAPPAAAIAGRVQVFRRVRAAPGEHRASSFQVLRRSIVPGSVVLIRCEAAIGAGFGSNVVLEAAACRAQAIVTDGPWRDATRIATVGIVAGANGAAPTRPAGCPLMASGTEEMFGVTWHDGDWFVRDTDGVLRLDADTARQVATEIASSAMGELASLIEQGPAG